MNIVAGSKSKTVLNSFLNEYSFGKIQYTLNLNDAGILAECSKKEFSENMKFVFSEWKFSGTQVESKSGNVLFVGGGFEGRTLLGLLGENQNETQGGGKNSAAFSAGNAAEKNAAAFAEHAASQNGRAAQNPATKKNDAASAEHADTPPHQAAAAQNAQKARAVFSYSVCVSQAVKEGRPLPANGAGGVLYGESKDKVRLLFLPPAIFQFAAANSPSEVFQKTQGVWQDQAFLSKNKADASNARSLFWTRAAIIYAALSGTFPFAKENLEERQADILDANYLPLKNKVNGVSEILSDAISFDLERSHDLAKNQNEINENFDEKKRNFCFEELAAELALKKDGSVGNCVRKEKMSKDEFEALAKKILGKKNARASASRTLRRNATQFTVGVLLLVAIFITRNYIKKDNLSKPTTISLSAREAAEVFFTGLHNLDTPLMQYSSKGKTAQNIIDSASNVYVSSKMRQAYSMASETLTPEMWLYRRDLKNSWQFGLTNFFLGEDESNFLEADLHKSFPTKKEKPAPLAEKNGAKKNFATRFFRVHSEGQEKIFAEKFSGKIELTFVKDRWLLTDANFLVEENFVEEGEFEKEREAALGECEGDAVLAADVLRKKYEWVPSPAAMRHARIVEETHAKKREQAGGR